MAQVFVDDDVAGDAPACRAALRPGGRLVFESRGPQRRAWCERNRQASHARRAVPGVGDLESWVEIRDAPDRRGRELVFVAHRPG